MDPTAAERSQALETLLELLSRGLRESNISDRAAALAGLAVTTEEQRQAREMLLGLLDQNPTLISSIVGHWLS